MLSEKFQIFVFLIIFQVSFLSTTTKKNSVNSKCFRFLQSIILFTNGGPPSRRNSCSKPTNNHSISQAQSQTSTSNSSPSTNGVSSSSSRTDPRQQLPTLTVTPSETNDSVSSSPTLVASTGTSTPTLYEENLSGSNERDNERLVQRYYSRPAPPDQEIEIDEFLRNLAYLGRTRTFRNEAAANNILSSFEMIGREAMNRRQNMYPRSNYRPSESQTQTSQKHRK